MGNLAELATFSDEDIYFAKGSQAGNSNTSACMESETLLWSDPSWTGYLDKYDDNAALWNRRFFLLQGPFLFYFLNELDRSSPLGLLPLEGSQVTEGSREGSRKYTLVIRVGPQYTGLGKQDKYILATTSAESLKDVIQRLADAADPPENLFGYLHKTWARAGELRGLLAKSSSDKKLLASSQGLEAQAIKTELVKSYLEMEELLKRVENKVSEADKKEQDSLKATALWNILSTKGNESNKTSSLSKLQNEIKFTRELCQTLQRKANYLQGQGLEDLTEEARNLLKRLLRLAMEVIHERHAKIRAEAPRYSFPVNAQIYNRGGELSKVSTLEFAKSNAGVLFRSTTPRIPSPSSKSHQISLGRAPPIPDVSKTSAATKGELPPSKSPQTIIAPYQVTSPTSNFTDSYALLLPPSTSLRPQLRPGGPLKSNFALPLRPTATLLFQPPPPSQEDSSNTTLQNSPTETSKEPVPSSQTLSLRSPLMLLKSFLPSQFRVPKFAPFWSSSTSSATAPIVPSLNSPPSLGKSVHSQLVTTKPPPPAPPRPLLLGSALKQPLIHKNPDSNSASNVSSTSPAPRLTQLQLRNPGPTSIRPNVPMTTVPPSSTQKNNYIPSSPAKPLSAVLRPAVSAPSSQNSLPSAIHPTQTRSAGPTLQQRMPLDMPQHSQTKTASLPATHIATALRGKLPNASADSKTPLPGPPAPPLSPPGGPITAGSLARVQPAEAKSWPSSQPPLAPPKSSDSEPAKPSAPSNLSPTSKQPLPSPPLPTRSPSLQNIPTTSSSFPSQSNVSPASLRGKLPPKSAFQPPKPDARPALPAASPALPLMSPSSRPLADPKNVPPSVLSKQPVSMPSQTIKPPSNASPPPRSAPQPRLPFPGQPPSRALMLFPPFEFKIPFLPSKLPMPGFNPSSKLDTPRSSALSKPPSTTTSMSAPPQPRPTAPGMTGPPAQSPLPSPHRSPTRFTSPYRQQPPQPPPLPGPPQLLKKPVGLPGSATQSPPRSPSQPMEKPAGAPPAPPSPPVLSTTTQGNKVATKLPSEKLEETNAKRAPIPQGPPPAPSVPPSPHLIPPPSAPSVPPSPRSMPPQFSPPPPRAQGMGMAPLTFRPPPSIPPSPRPMLPLLSPAGARAAPPVPPSPRSVPPQFSRPPPRPQGMGMAPSRPPPPQGMFPATPAPLQGSGHPNTDSGHTAALKKAAAATAPPPPAPSLMSQSPRLVTSSISPTKFRPPPPPPVPPRAYRPSSLAALHFPPSNTLPSTSITAPGKPPEAQTTIPSAGTLRRSSSSPSLLPSFALATPSPFQQKLPPPPSPSLPSWLPRGTLQRHVDINSKVVQIISQCVPQAGSQQSSVGEKPFPKLAVDENTEELLDTVGFAALNLLKHIFNQAESYIQHNQDVVLRGVEASKDWIKKTLPSNGKDRADASKEMGSDASIDTEKRDQSIELRRAKSSEFDKRDEPPEFKRETGIKAVEMRESNIGRSEEATQNRDATTEIEKHDKAAETRESEIEKHEEATQTRESDIEKHEEAPQTRESEIEKHEEATQTRESASIEKSRDAQTQKRNEGTYDTKEPNQADSKLSEKVAASDVSPKKVPAFVERVAPDLRESLPEAESRKLAFGKKKPVATQTEITEESSASANEQARNGVQRGQLKPMKADSSAPSQRKAPRQQRAQETLYLQNCAGLRPLPVLKARKAPTQQVSPNFYYVSQHLSPPVERPVKRDNRVCYSQPNDPYRRMNTPQRQVQSDAYGRLYSPQEQCQDGSYRRMHTPQQQGRDGSYQRMMNSSQGQRLYMRTNTPHVSRPATLRRPVRMEMDYELSSNIDLGLDSHQGNLDNHSKGAARHQTPSPTPSSHSMASIVSSRHPSASSTSDSESGSEDNDSDDSASTPQISIDLSCTYEFDFISRR